MIPRNEGIIIFKKTQYDFVTFNPLGRISTTFLYVLPLINSTLFRHISPSTVLYYIFLCIKKTVKNLKGNCVIDLSQGVIDSSHTAP